MKSWNIVSTHLIEASCHCNDVISKKAVSTIHDVITAVLSSHTELPHFHTNESLFKPYENLLILELCGSDVQELIISSICEFVEGSTEDIKSGWRSLFGALKAIKLTPLTDHLNKDDLNELQNERVRQLRIILDIFEAFLHTDNLQVFANAAVECLLCLLRLLKDPSLDKADAYSSPAECSEGPDLCLVSLQYLHQFESLLRSMYQMPSCPLFTSNRKIQLRFLPRIINFSDFGLPIDLKAPTTLADLDRPVKVLHVWFLLIEGLNEAYANGFMYVY